MDPDPPALPSGFLGGSAPLVQEAVLRRIPFLQYPPFLLSARDLVTLSLSGIPLSGFISQVALVTDLAAALKLGTLSIGSADSRQKPCTHTDSPSFSHVMSVRRLQ